MGIQLHKVGATSPPIQGLVTLESEILDLISV